MQTAKIKIGDTYAFHRSGKLARFVVQSIVNTRTKGQSVNVIKGYVEEDRKEGQPLPETKMDPENLIGPYAEQAELVERKIQEEAKRKAEADEKTRLASLDRLALYRFVGMPVPKVKPDEYSQPFRLTGYYSSTVDISNDGTKLIIAAVHALQAQERDPGDPSPELIAAAQQQWKREGKV